MSASCVNRTLSTKHFIRAKMGAVAIHQGAIYASAGQEQDQTVQILDADLCLAKLKRWS